MTEPGPADLTAFRVGRRHSNPDGSTHGNHHWESRKSFQRDRDRLLYSTPLRRLAGVTQVASADEGHIFHNRLTHTLKVAQIARRTAQALHSTGKEDETGQIRSAIAALGGLDPCVCESAALAHDIGHPPFGHAAEGAIQSVARDELKSRSPGKDSFEGNAQSFRIVTQVATKAGQYNGLNLTRATRNALLKYPWSIEDAPEEYRDPPKWGYYATEAEDFFDARSKDWGAPPGDRTLEAEVMDWSDDVAYAVHDLEDFYRAGILPLDEILRGGPAREKFFDHDKVKKAIDSHQKKAKAADVDPLDHSTVFDEYVDELGGLANLKDKFQGKDDQVRSLHRFSSDHITRFLSVRTKQRDKAPSLTIRPGDEPEFIIHPHSRFLVELMKLLSEVFVFQAQPLMIKQDGQKQAVSTIIKQLFEATGGNERDLGRFPEPFREHLLLIKRDQDLSEDDRDHACFRQVVDFVCSLNETQTMDLHRSITGSNRSSVLQPLLV